MTAGKKLPSWTSRKSGGEQTDALAVEPQAAHEEQPEDIQAAVDASEDMQVAMQDFGLTEDLYMVIGVSRVWLPPVPANRVSDPFCGPGILQHGRQAILPQAPPRG